MQWVNETKRCTNKMMGLKLKVLTSKADPQILAMIKLEFRRGLAKITKGLMNLKIKRDELLLLCLTNPYRHQDPVESEPGLDGIKTISIPLNF
jgi:hypothetical protein